MFPVLEFYHDQVPRSAPMNMALDEVLWASATKPALRVYQWDHPALSFGFFGRYEDVAQYERERKVVRRCTGGGIVFHGSDLTYALVIPATEKIYGKSSQAIYDFVHQAIKGALSASGVSATLAQPGGDKQSATDTIGPCFANPVTADVLVNNQKVAGAAQRRSRGGLLQQGSVQNVKLGPKFCEKFAESLSAGVVSCEIEPNCLEKAHRLAESKYGTETWLKRR